MYHMVELVLLVDHTPSFLFWFIFPICRQYSISPLNVQPFNHFYGPVLFSQTKRIGDQISVQFVTKPC